MPTIAINSLLLDSAQEECNYDYFSDITSTTGTTGARLWLIFLTGRTSHPSATVFWKISTNIFLSTSFVSSSLNSISGGDRLRSL